MTHEDIITLIRQGDSEAIGAEKLRGLLKILPAQDEVCYVVVEDHRLLLLIVCIHPRESAFLRIAVFCITHRPGPRSDFGLSSGTLKSRGANR
jgi:hypothetical protein